MNTDSTVDCQGMGMVGIGLLKLPELSAVLSWVGWLARLVCSVSTSSGTVDSYSHELLSSAYNVTAVPTRPAAALFVAVTAWLCTVTTVATCGLASSALQQCCNMCCLVSWSSAAVHYLPARRWVEGVSRHTAGFALFVCVCVCVWFIQQQAAHHLMVPAQSAQHPSNLTAKALL
jgi:hypothetical protein